MADAHSDCCEDLRRPGADAPVPDGAVRVDAMANLPRVLRDLGLDPDELLVAAGLDPRIFDDWLNEVPLASIGRLLDLAVSATGCDHVGLLVGAPAQPASLGVVALLAQSAPDVGTALRNFRAHVHLRDRGGVVPFVIDGETAMLGYEVYQPGVEAIDQICDGSIAMGMNMLRDLCGPTWRPLEVTFAHRRPSDLQPFRRFFDAPLRFDAERTGIVFDASWLKRPSQRADVGSFGAFLERVMKAEAQFQGDLVSELRRLLRTHLLTGEASVGELAERLSMHRRTLNRRLRSQGTSVHQLLEGARFELSRQLIENTRLPLTDIAATLGYADSSAFTRAFSRWTGRPPSAWRKQAGPALSRTAKLEVAASPNIAARG